MEEPFRLRLLEFSRLPLILITKTYSKLNILPRILEILEVLCGVWLERDNISPHLPICSTRRCLREYWMIWREKFLVHSSWEETRVMSSLLRGWTLVQKWDTGSSRVEGSWEDLVQTGKIPLNGRWTEMSCLTEQGPDSLAMMWQQDVRAKIEQW